MPRTESRTELRFAAIIFLFTAAVLFAMHGSRVVLTNDEGILLEPAQRVANGAHPYTDFFAYMSPGSYWIQAAVFRIFGVAMWTGRVPVIFDFALQCALVFWLAARLTSKIVAAMIVTVFAGFQVADPSFLTAQHRWDSSTLALAGIAIAVDSVLGKSTRIKWIACGVLMGAAAWCTPAIAMAGGAVMLWMAIDRARRKDLIWVAAGVAAISAEAIARLAFSGSFGGFVKQMIWLQKNYSAVNIMPYGSILGGYRALFSGVAGFSDLSIRSILVACLALPAILPIFSIILSIVLWKLRVIDRRAIELLVVVEIALVASVFPRADVMHLAFVVAIPYVLTGVAMARLMPARAAFPIAVFAMLLASVFAANFVNGFKATRPIDSAVGRVRVGADQAADFERLFDAVHPSASLFVHPYLPVAYFLTQARNPTRYAYMNPGMMTAEDERAVVAELEADPPEFLLYLKLSREEFLRVFPHGGAMNWRYETLEAWLDRNYTPAENPAVTIGGYQLWRRASTVQPLSAAR